MQVAKLSQSWRDATNAKRASQRGGFGGISGLEKKRQYRTDDSRQEDRYGMVFDREEMRRKPSERESHRSSRRERSRSRSPRRRDYHDDRHRDRHRDRRYDDERRYERSRHDSRNDDRSYDRRRR